MTVPQSQPTRYLIEEKHLSLDNRFIITDDEGVIHYKVNSKFFTMGDKLLISDANGNELIKIRQDKFHFHLTYKVFSLRSGVPECQTATIKRTGSMLQHKLEIDSVNGEYIMQKKEGVSSNEFTLTKDGSLVAFATKDVSPTKSLFWVDIIDNKEEDHAFVLAMVVVLSCAQRLPGHHMAKPHTDESKI
jgi:uncharacterized protein YxjI